jgi:hypothetical protein
MRVLCSLGSRVWRAIRLCHCRDGRVGSTPDVQLALLGFGAVVVVAVRFIPLRWVVLAKS